MLKATFSDWFANIKPDFHEILPIDLLAINGAIVFGNPSTPRLLVAKFVEARGSYSVLPVSALGLFLSVWLSCHIYAMTYP